MEWKAGLLCNPMSFVGKCDGTEPTQPWEAVAGSNVLKGFDSTDTVNANDID